MSQVVRISLIIAISLNVFGCGGSSDDACLGTEFLDAAQQCVACTEPSEQQYVSGVCTPNSNSVVAACTPAPALDSAQYVSTACIQGSITELGHDTIIANCQTSIAAGQFVSRLCKVIILSFPC